MQQTTFVDATFECRARFDVEMQFLGCHVL